MKFYMDKTPKMYGRRNWKQVNSSLGGTKMMSAPVASSTRVMPKAKPKAKPKSKAKPKMKK